MITQDVPDVMAAIPESELSDFDRWVGTRSH